jgi:hypothetical protein
VGLGLAVELELGIGRKRGCYRAGQEAGCRAAEKQAARRRKEGELESGIGRKGRLRRSTAAQVRVKVYSGPVL